VFMGLLLVVFWIVCILIVAIVLVQSGKQSGFAGAFGSGGGGQTAFGARSGSFMTRLTAGLAVTFMLLALVLVLAGSRGPSGDAPDEVAAPDTPAAGQTVDWIEDIPVGEVGDGATGANPVTVTETSAVVNVTGAVTEVETSATPETEPAEPAPVQAE
jgi:preprotein translocase subunit SecG